MVNQYSDGLAPEAFRGYSLLQYPTEKEIGGLPAPRGTRIDGAHLRLGHI